MPPKDTQTTGSLMFSTDGGKTLMPLGEISDIEITADTDEANDNTLTGVIPWGMVGLVADYIDRRTLLSIITGRKITNNWLKMHGFPMVRRRKR